MSTVRRRKRFILMKPLAKEAGISSIEQKECNFKTDEEIM